MRLDASKSALRGRILDLVATSKTAGFPMVVIIWLLVVVSRPDMVWKLEYCRAFVVAAVILIILVSTCALSAEGEGS